MKDKRSIVTVRDVSVLVITAALAILAAAVLFALTELAPLFIGMLTVFLYMAFLSVYLSLRLPVLQVGNKTPDKEENGGDLTAFLRASHHPTVLCDLKSTVLWYNAAFKDQTEGYDLSRPCRFDDICLPVNAEELPAELSKFDLRTLDGELYVCEKTYMSTGGGCHLYVLRCVSAWHETARLLDATQSAFENARTAVAYIIIDNVEDMLQYIHEKFRDSVSMVLQKNLLFSGTIKENLRWGNAEATDEEMIEACRLAQAHDFISSFPEGYDTFIEQGGTNVSGGQKQRLCIARALLKKPKILILDDSTSAVDTRTDALIREGFKKFIPETTKIIIAQRISSVQDADMIIVLDKGEISAIGKHDELLTKSDIYREVYEQQTGGNDNE
jgi:ABC-type phosphate transport system ATPase subunit